MTSDNIRKILTLQAIEQSDEAQILLKDPDYREAASHAGSPLPKEIGSTGENEFLRKRAEFLLIRTTSRFPEFSQWANEMPSRHRLGIFAIVLFLIAAALGFLTNELGPEKRINILSFPLLGILLWSLLVYLREFFLLMKRRGSLGDEPKSPGFVELLQPSLPEADSSDVPEQRVLEGARVLFQKRWRMMNTPVFAARLKSILHSTALILATAAIAGMYVKGLANEYRAVWESTFFSDSAQLRPFLQVVLGPAISLMGDTLPSAEDLAAIHWQAGDSEISGENAGRWIHWYAINLAIFVILPRGILSAIWRVKAHRLEVGFPFRKVSPEYYEHLLAVTTGSSLEVSIVPYLASPVESSKRAILRTLEDEFEKPVKINWMAAIPFGEEENESAELEGEIIPLFDFSATPEKETHLMLYQTLLHQAPNPVRFVLLDTLSFEEKSKRFSDEEKRLDSRLTAWKNLFDGQEVEFLCTGSLAGAKTSANI